MKPPVKNLVLKLHPSGDVTQFFGENPWLYGRFGLIGHNGIDIVRPHGEMMYAVEDGEIINVKDSPEGFGKHVRILSKEKDKKGHYNEWVYGHCDTILVSVGDKVHAGQEIATMGNTGFVVSGATPFWKTNPFAGTHLHIGQRKVRKTSKGWSYEGSKVKIDVVDYDNGFKGSIDPYSFLMQLSDEDMEYRNKLLTLRSLLNLLATLLTPKK